VLSAPSKELVNPTFLATFGLFQDLPADVMERLAGSVRHQVLAPNTTLMTVGQSGEAVYMILSGTVKVHIEQPDGTDVLIAVLGPGEIVGELSLLDNTGRSASVRTLDETECLWMDREAFRNALTTIPGFALNLAKLLSARLRLANGQIQALVALDLESRVARQLLAFAQRYGQEQPGGAILIPIRLTQSDLSNMIGASREQTNKVLVSYRSRGYLSVDASYRFTLLKPEMLARRAL
jgi:CRP/FNR family transcriptional regulator, cyclic AMP receptor protein